MRNLLLTLGLGHALADCGCTSDETCCSDDAGYACCIDQTTYCVQKNPGVKNYPSRCCPVWTVGCSVGSVGCCDPARPWQRILSAPLPMAGHAAAGNGKPRNGAPALTVYALFTASVTSDLTCLTISASTGDIVHSVLASGPVKDYDAGLYGESTRVFPFDPTRGKFFFFDIDQQTASAHSEITMYALDPATGASTKTTVEGATGPVVSFAYHPESATIVLAVGSRNDSSVAFFSVDLDSAKALALGSVSRGASESDSAAYYAGYITEVNSAKSSVYRLGYKSVTTGTTPGLGATALNGSGAEWHSVPGAPHELFYYSMTRHAESEKFISLAPSASPNHTLSVVSWFAGASPAAVILDVPDAHPPASGGTGILGYVADTLDANTYGAYATTCPCTRRCPRHALIFHSPLSHLVLPRRRPHSHAPVALVVKTAPSVVPGLKDKWELVYVDLAAREGASVVLSGKGFDALGAETVSVSGVGIKSATRRGREAPPQSVPASLRRLDAFERARNATRMDLLTPAIPGVANACLVALGVLSATPAVAAAFAKVAADGEAAGLAAGKGCALTIAVTHSCAMHYDWSPYTADLSAYTAATVAADPSSTLCSIDFTATELVEPFGSISMAVTQEVWIAVPGACTAADRAAMLNFYQSQATSSANLTDVSFQYHSGCL